MTEAQIKATMTKVLGRIAPEAHLDEVDPHENLREALDLDSMDFLHFLVGLHEDLGVDIPESDYGRLTTTASIVDYIKDADPQQAPKE